MKYTLIIIVVVIKLFCYFEEILMTFKHFLDSLLIVFFSFYEISIVFFHHHVTRLLINQSNLSFYKS